MKSGISTFMLWVFTGRRGMIKKYDRRKYLNQKGLREREEIDPDEVFILEKKVTTITDGATGIENMPKENEYVYTGNDVKIMLLRKLGDGGEGIVYYTNTPFLAKIYKPDKLTMRQYKKICKMVQKRIDCEGICYPVAVLYDDERRFVGCMLPEAKGVKLFPAVMVISRFQKTCEGWEKLQLVKLCISILKKFQYLHDRNVLVGDISPQNILFNPKNPEETYFIDTDSFQIEEYPCPVGTQAAVGIFLAPETMGKNFAEFLRTKESENYVIATLMFKILMLGTQPYAQKGGESAEQNFKKQDFPYVVGKESDRLPQGRAGSLWRHLPLAIQDAFYETFQKGGAYSRPETRLTADEWQFLFQEYKRELESGAMKRRDPEGEKAIPNDDT